MAEQRTFAAFISYSHAADGRFGPVLQEAIVKFARPWYRLSDRRGAHDVAAA